MRSRNNSGAAISGRSRRHFWLAHMRVGMPVWMGVHVPMRGPVPALQGHDAGRLGMHHVRLVHPRRGLHRRRTWRPGGLGRGNGLLRSLSVMDLREGQAGRGRRDR